MLTSKEIAHLAVKALDDKLARDIQILKTDKVTVLADYFILCIRLRRQMTSIAVNGRVWPTCSPCPDGYGNSIRP